MIRKQYLKSKPLCKVTFEVPAQEAADAQSICVAGDFNGWDTAATPMKRKKDGSFFATVSLETGRDYQFRYLFDGESWQNDSEADRYMPSPYGNCENCVVEV
jgi:1,4-alpha-glucan branching enzyme